MDWSALKKWLGNRLQLKQLNRTAHIFWGISIFVVMTLGFIFGNFVYFLPIVPASTLIGQALGNGSPDSTENRLRKYNRLAKRKGWIGKDQLEELTHFTLKLELCKIKSEIKKINEEAQTHISSADEKIGARSDKNAIDQMMDPIYDLLKNQK